MTTLLTRLQDKGWRLTAQRRAVAEALHGDNCHLTADEITTQARSILPEVALATVYNTLAELVAMGEVRELVLGAGPKRYDPNLEPHDHLVDLDSGEVVDIPPVDRTALASMSSAPEGYDVVRTEIVLHARRSD